MEAFVLRVIEEKEQLDKKIEALKAFRRSDVFSTLTYEEQYWLIMQLTTMQQYQEILELRIMYYKRKENQS